MLIWEKRKIYLNYLYEITRIPIWIIKKNKLFYSSCELEFLRNEDELVKFFAFFTNKTSEIPQLMILGDMELFAVFTFYDDNERGYLIAGPAFNIHPIDSGYIKHLSFDYIFQKEMVKNFIIKTPVINPESFCKYIQILALEMNKKLYDIQTLNLHLKHTALNKIFEKKLAKAIFDIKEESKLSVFSYDRERKILPCVRNGDIEGLRKLAPLQGHTFRGAIAVTTKKQHEYGVIALVTLLTRAAVEGGVDVDTAYTLSDLYLHEVSNIEANEHNRKEKLMEIASQALFHFTEMVAKHKHLNIPDRSKHIKNCIRYIQMHLHYPITLKSVAKEIGITPKYLSKHFFAETGEKFTRFIQKERIAEAVRLLDNSDLTITEISNSLVFNSQSYFIKVFTDIMNITPKKYLKAQNPQK